MKRYYCNEVDARRLLRYERKTKEYVDKLDVVQVKGAGGLSAREDCFAFYVANSRLKGKAAARAVAGAGLRCGFSPAQTQELMAAAAVQARISYYKAAAISPDDYDDIRALAVGRLAAAAATSPADFLSTPAIDARRPLAIAPAAAHLAPDTLVAAVDDTAFIDALTSGGAPAQDCAAADSTQGGGVDCTHKPPSPPSTPKNGGVPGPARGGPNQKNPQNLDKKEALLMGLVGGLSEPSHRAGKELEEYESTRSIGEILVDIEEVDEGEGGGGYSYIQLADGNLVRYRGIDELPINALLSLKSVKLKNLGNAKEPILVYDYDVHDGRDSAELLLKYIGEIGSNQRSEAAMDVNEVADILGRAAKRVDKYGGHAGQVGQVVDAELEAEDDGQEDSGYDVP